jgi:hypothetical protein
MAAVTKRSVQVVVLGAYAAGLAAACTTATLPQDMCSWMRDGNNCLQRFLTDVGNRCGADPIINNDPLKTLTGYFQTRDKLDICVKSAGGQVIFDPPLDVKTFPLSSVSFKILDEKAVQCGTGSARAGLNNFSITINPATNAANPGDPITGGTFSMTAIPENVNTFDVSCPGGLETHHFNNLVLTKGDFCKATIPYQPTAFIDSSPGIPETDTAASVSGYVRLRIQYPPTNTTAAGVTPRTVEYFSCAIPAPPPPCQDGVKNGDETAIDCGGSCATKKGIKCVEGQSCVSGTDCQSGKCDTVAGIKQCGK